MNFDTFQFWVCQCHALKPNFEHRLKRADVRVFLLNYQAEDVGALSTFGSCSPLAAFLTFFKFLS